MSSTFRGAAIFFDLDGTLVNSHAVVERVWAGWATRHGIPPAELIAACYGRPAKDTMRQFRPDFSDAELQAMVETHLREEEDDITGMIAIPGAAELLASLPEERWAIVTSCPPKLARIRREAAGLPEPNLIVHGTDIRNGKPAPDGYLLAAERMGVRPSDCLVVEDAPAGIAAGKAAGMKVLALTTTVRQPEGADFVRPDFSGFRVAAEGGQLLVEMP